jgi:predicted TIM-barrel fold metal-dependent hydrolase
LSEFANFAQQMMSQKSRQEAEESEGRLMRVVTIEEHWTTPEIDRALRTQPSAVRDESLALNDVGDISARLFDLGEARIEAMDAAGIDVQILSLAPPGTHGLPAADAVALAREANDRASAAVERYPTRLRALTTLPMSDPDAALAELERTAGVPGHVGIMSYGRSGDRPLDDPANDEVLAAAARLRRPIFIHPQVPPNAVRDASYRGFDPLTGLALATFGWGWHAEAGLAALRLIARGTFDRHPDLQIVLGHWGEIPACSARRWSTPASIASCFRATIHSIDWKPGPSKGSWPPCPVVTPRRRSPTPTPRRSTASARTRGSRHDHTDQRTDI